MMELPTEILTSGRARVVEVTLPPRSQIASQFGSSRNSALKEPVSKQTSKVKESTGKARDQGPHSPKFNNRRTEESAGDQLVASVLTQDEAVVAKA